ncbi:MAG: family 43 glycosylhydrolase [Clostridiales bacterium]|nr:family 43 glycosylhydrolase [Clostridiales bacterium]
MKLNFGANRVRPQADPFIFEDGGRYYIYVTGGRGVEAYSSDAILGEWHYEGIVLTIGSYTDYWAPCIVKVGEWYHIYTSCSGEGMFEFLHTARAPSPLGPFGEPKRLFDRFSIDAHVVQTSAGLFLWYAEDNTDTDRIGTRVFVDRLIDPYTPEYKPAEVIVPTFDEEIFMRNRLGDGRDWHTIEGAFWFEEEGWQYVMYSGACYQNDTYHIGYCSAKSGEGDPRKVDFIKHTDNGAFDPLMTKNGYEEGVGHNSVIKITGSSELADGYYAVYHARDIVPECDMPGDRRTARICRLHVKDGVITAERHEDRV